jgi:predicted kinase
MVRTRNGQYLEKSGPSVEIVVLTGIPGSGKSRLAKTKFQNYIRVNLDTVRSRRAEEALIMKSLDDSCSVVIDNTNTTINSRKKYIDVAKRAGVRVSSVYLACPLEVALQRNSKREGKERVPDFVVKIYSKKLEVPSLAEGFDSVEIIQTDQRFGGNGRQKRQK